MKVLFDHPSPFALAHGGFQLQIEETKAALERSGVEVEFVRWWDDRQTGDIIHFFGPPSLSYLEMARNKGIPVVATNLFTATCNRTPLQLAVQGAITRTLLALPGWNMVKNQLPWKGYATATRMVVGLKAEQRVLQTVYGVPESRISVVPLGLNRDFLEAVQPSRTDPHLITTGTITARKRCIELALMARAAKVPILFVGKPYRAGDAYWKKFSALIDGQFVLHREHVDSRAEMIALLQASRGFVIYSRYENWCLSAHEAAACGLPVLLPDMPWSRECFGTEASYLHAATSSENPGRLRTFHEKSATLGKPAIHFYSWDEVAGQLKTIYAAF